MKHKIWYNLIAITLLLASCTPIDDRESLGELLAPSQINIDVHGITEGSNKIVMINNTPNVGGMWYDGMNTSTRQNDTITWPFLGKATIYFYATTSGGIVKDSVVVNVTKMDFAIAPQWNYLAGSETSGKTWVWATDDPEYDGVCYGDGAYLSDMYPSWDGYDQSFLEAAGVDKDEMTFDLNGGPNFTLITGNNGLDVYDNEDAGLPAGTYHGKFSFNMSKTLASADDPSQLWAIGQLKLTGATVSEGIDPDDDSAPVYTYDILMLTDDEMILAAPTPGAGPWDGAWYWIFKRKGYSFSE
ncbi:MAG: hypothetical protein LLG05_06605 [Porphyromonadaceae bacterium]|nr:hypothetical protein [Porphyromonadaceae bacterium]